MKKYDHLYIGGEWVAPSSADVIEVVSPSTEEVIGSVPSADGTDVDRAVAAAREAFDNGPWPRMTPVERAEVLAAVSRKILERADDFAQTLASEAGLPVSIWARPEQATTFIDYFVKLASTFPFEEVREGITVGSVLVRWEPVGVVAAVLPWNSPIAIGFMKLAPALIAGCTVVYKPAPETPLYSCILAEVFDEVGLPPGVFNLLPAERQYSEALVAHPGVDKVSFTGSTATGRRVAELCASSFKKYSLELGGKSAAIVLDDVDLGSVLPILAMTTMLNNGEACVLQSRVLVSRDRYTEVSEALAGAISHFKLGDPMELDTFVGPMITPRQQTKVMDYVSGAIDDGAKPILGGPEKPAGFDRGYYVAPTVLTGVNNKMRVAREEIFGPVVSMIPYDDEADAVAIANDTSYGLSGTVWTSDIHHGLQVARKVQTGNFGVNIFGIDPTSPFGGYKESGVGRECGPEGLREFMQAKSINLPEGALPQ
ncbi:aldehyde dehydrogenase [Mycobacterium kyogaense]|uniref:aldehyde dehydrogenase n=1 Tax=Mycobacterium kyogaense TaxID=2212479 RepID=UPI000DAD8FCA|nr:aldehyde dehydrogenase [Mycobacterium kyogaense]